MADDRAGDRHVADLHRLHADDEGVGERAGDEERRRRAADRRVAPGEVPDVGDEGGGVQRERDEVHARTDVGVVGAK